MTPRCHEEYIQSCVLIPLAFKFFLVEICGSLYTTWACIVVEEFPRALILPPKRLVANPGTGRGAWLTLHWNSFFPLYPNGLDMTQSILFKKLKILCVFHGIFHMPVSDSFPIKVSKHWFYQTSLPVLTLVGSSYLLSRHRSSVSAVQTFACLIAQNDLKQKRVFY